MGEDSGDEAGIGGGWLSPRTLLDKTTKFVLNAAHGKTRTLLPTTEPAGRGFAETGVLDWGDDIDAGAEDEAEEHAAEPQEHLMLVPERDVLCGRWNDCAVVGDEQSALSPAPPGMLRIVRPAVPPPRRRTATRPGLAGTGAAGQLRQFTALPARVVARVLELLPVDAMLAVANSCRVLRRAMHAHGPGAAGSGAAGAQAYTGVGLRVWRARIGQMGWRMWHERRRGLERRPRIAVPPSHARLLARLSGVDGEAAVLELVRLEPDLVFKAVYAELIGDYSAFARADRCVPALAWAGDGRLRGARSAAERLDQLLWFARGRFTGAADAANRRLVAAADAFEAAHLARFKRALVAGDRAQMRRCALVLAGIRDGRACVRVLVDAHPLFNGAPAPRYSAVLDAGARVADAHTFDAFLGALHSVIAEHARVVAAVLPVPALQESALHAFVQALFASPAGSGSGSGVALGALRRLYAHLRAIPVADQISRGERGLPDAATRDIVYLSTVASVVSLVLDKADAWAQMPHVRLPRELGRRCVFAAFDGVIDEYVLLERRVIERAYEGEVAQWAARAARDSVAAAEAAAADAAARLVNFRQRQQQLDEYRDRVLLVLQDRLQITLEGSSSNGGKRPRRRSSASHEAPRRTVVGDVLGYAPISIDLCLNMVLTNRDTIERLAVFAEAPPDMRLREKAQDAIESVVCSLLQNIGNHLRPAFGHMVAELKDLEHTVMLSLEQHQQQQSGDTAYTAAQAQAEQQARGKFASAELRFFELIHLSDLCVQLLEIYFKSYVAQFIDQHDFLSQSNQERRGLERLVDDSVAVGMDCVISIIMSQTQHIVHTEQRASDFSPDSNVSLALTPTLACTRAVQFLGESTVVLQSMAQRQVRAVFVGEVGLRLVHVLLDHVKQFRITEPGGFQLIADLNLYYDWAAANVDPDILRYFAALKDLANCFILAPRDLRGFLKDQYSRHTFDGVMRSEEVYDVVACRADYRAIRSQVEGHCDFM
ncbi:F-box protein: endocytic membrane traffic, recycling ReCYcling 1 [Coemansia sp. RSA 2708]|nr:F-box protein: endocytic membrane traffic, recycling ReCYcling 1 [Coemansia sp. RSA 2708]